MKLTNSLKDYLNNSYSFINSNILFCSLDKILLTYTFTRNDDFKDKHLSKDFIKYIEEWQKFEKYNDNNFAMINNFFIKLIDDDPCTYSGQLIFPIYHNNNLDGFIIFFRERGNYGLSSCKAPETTRNFAELMSDDNNFRLKLED